MTRVETKKIHKNFSAGVSRKKPRIRDKTKTIQDCAFPLGNGKRHGWSSMKLKSKWPDASAELPHPFTRETVPDGLSRNIRNRQDCPEAFDNSRLDTAKRRRCQGEHRATKRNIHTKTRKTIHVTKTCIEKGRNLCTSTATVVQWPAQDGTKL